MSVWIDINDRKPPLDEEVLILYKDKNDELVEENLHYGIARLIERSSFVNSEYKFLTWSYFISYQGYYEVVFWTPLVDLPRINSI